MGLTAFDEALEALTQATATGNDLHLITDEELNDLAESLASAAARWYETGRQEGVTQRWPDGNIDTYETYVTYTCDEGLFAGVNLALGMVAPAGEEGEVIGFVLGAGGGSRRPLTVFFPADDFSKTRERLSMIRGRDGGRKGYGPDERLQPVYEGDFKTELLSARIAGKWNVKAVVATDDDSGIQDMLSHTAIQARMRGLI